MGQSTYEAAYGGYARVSMPRDADTWTVAGNIVTNAIPITFPANAGIAYELSHVGIGNEETTDGDLVGSRIITDAPRTVGVGNSPRLPIGTLKIEFEGDLATGFVEAQLKLLFQNIALVIGDGDPIAAPADPGQVWISLHTQSPSA